MNKLVIIGLILIILIVVVVLIIILSKKKSPPTGESYQRSDGLTPENVVDRWYSPFYRDYEYTGGIDFTSNSEEIIQPLFEKPIISNGILSIEDVKFTSIYIGENILLQRRTFLGFLSPNKLNDLFFIILFDVETKDFWLVGVRVPEDVSPDEGIQQSYQFGDDPERVVFLRSPSGGEDTNFISQNMPL